MLNTLIWWLWPFVLLFVLLWAEYEIGKQSKIGMMLANAIVTMASWVGCDWVILEPGGVLREVKDWKREVWNLMLKIAVEEKWGTEGLLLREVYSRLRPQIVAYGRVDREILHEIAPLFEYTNKSTGREVTVYEMERNHRHYSS